MGSTHKTIYMPDIESIKVPIPPVDDQDRVVEAAHAQHQPLQTGVARLDAQLELLTERRQALITAAVTGQIEVPVAA